MVVGDVKDPIADMTPSRERSYMAAVVFFNEKNSWGKNFLVMYPTSVTFGVVPEQSTPDWVLSCYAQA